MQPGVSFSDVTLRSAYFKIMILNTYFTQTPFNQAVKTRAA